MPLADDSQALVQEAMRHLGLENANQLAKWLGYHDDERRKVNHWAKGDAKPSYDATIQLLRALGMLQEEPAGAQAAATGGGTSASASEEAVVLLRELGAAALVISQGTKRLEGQLSKLAELAASPDSAQWREAPPDGRRLGRSGPRQRTSRPT